MKSVSDTVMHSILTRLKSGDCFETPVARKPFKISNIHPLAVTVQVGENKDDITITEECWNGIPEFLEGKGWVEIGATHRPPDPPRGSLDEYLQYYTGNISVASYVVPILERLLIVQVDRTIPSKVRLI